MAASPPVLEVRIAVEPQGLHGGDVEIAPYVGTYTSIPGQRMSELAPVGQGAAPVVRTLRPLPAHQMRGDEMLHVEQFSRSRDSFQEDINKIEHDHVERTLQCGRFELGVRHLAAAAATGKPLQATLVDPILFDTLHAQLAAQRPPQSAAEHAALEREAVARATKGTATVMVRAVGGGDPGAYARALEKRRAQAGYLLYDTPEFARAMAEATDRMLQPFSTHFFSGNGGADPVASPPKHPLNPRTPSGNNLFLVQYKSAFGTLPVAGFFMSRPHPDHLAPATESAAERADALDHDSAQYYDRMLGAALVRHGRDLAWLQQATRTQLARKHDDATVSADWLEAKAVVADASTFAANALNYTSDVRFENAAGGNAPRRADSLNRRARYAAHTQLVSALARRFAEGAAAAPTVSKDAVPVESFDKAPVQGTSNAADCEDQSNVVLCVYNDLHECARRFADGSDGGAAKFPALAAARELLDMHVASAAACTVSSAMYNAEGKEVTRDDLVANGLPIKGSAADAATTAKDGGHCTVVVQPAAVVARQLASAGVNVAAEAPGLLRGRTPAAWEYAQGAQILEGTGPVESWVIPTAELGAPEFTQRALARRTVIRALRDKAPTLTGLFKLKAPGFTDVARPLEQRASPFYHDVFFLHAPRLYAENPALGLFGVCDAQSGVRGCEFGELLRDRGTQLALVSPYHRESGTWRKHILPVMACAMNQMPATTVARFAPAAANAQAPLAASSRLMDMALKPLDVTLGRLGHVLADEVVAGFARFDTARPWTLSAALDAHSRGLRARALNTAQAFAAPAPLPAAGVGDADTTTVALYTAPWRLSAADLDKVLREIDALKAAGLVSAHAFLRDRPLAQCDDVITLRLAVPVK